MIIKSIIKIINILLWLYQYYTIKLDKSQFAAKLLNLNQYKKIIILIPHADDELIGCYNLITQSKEQILSYYFGFVGSNFSEQNAIFRKNELRDVASNLNLKLLISNGNIYNEIKSILINENVDLICVPNFIDWHKEHVEVSKILIDVIDELEKIKNKVSILAYQVSVPLLECDITHYLPMNKEVHRQKWHLFNIYKSQRTMPVFRFKLNEKLSGKLIQSHAAEVYKLSTFFQYKSEFEKWQNVDKSILKKNINNIINIRNLVKQIYCRGEFQ